MWGEIVEPVKTQPILTEEEHDGGKFELPVKVEIPYPKFTINQPTDPRQQRQDTPVSSTVTLKTACNDGCVSFNFALPILWFSAVCEPGWDYLC